jgi:hypothetical protein
VPTGSSLSWAPREPDDRKNVIRERFEAGGSPYSEVDNRPLRMEYVADGRSIRSAAAGVDTIVLKLRRRPVPTLYRRWDG